MTDPVLLQALADRIAGVSNGHHTAVDFPPPLNALWAAIEAEPDENPNLIFQQWVGDDPDRLDVAGEIFALKPGGSPPAHPWKLRSLADAYQPRPPLIYVVEGLLSLPSLTVWYGAPGSLKSMILADLLVCTAGHIDWLPPYPHTGLSTPAPRPTLQVPCLWVDFDNGQRRTDERFAALARSRGLPETIPLRYVAMPDPWLDASDMSQINELGWLIKNEGFKVVVFDNLGTVSGGKDENSAEMLPIMSNFRRLAESTGCAVNLIHHERKATGYVGRTGERLRGHSSIEQAIDLALMVKREQYSDSIEIHSTKTRDVNVRPFGAFFQYTQLPANNELETARFWGEETETTTNPQQDLRDAILLAVKTYGPAAAQKAIVLEIKKTSTIGERRIERELGEMSFNGLLKRQMGAHRSWLYDLP